MINNCMKYTIYQITNKLNGKVYIGKHQTENVDDNYFGSGVALRNAIKKHGKENFVKEILFIFDTESEMNNKEKEIITEEFVARKDTYNLGVGGEGGPHFKDKKHKQKSIEKMLQTRKDYVRPETSLEIRKKISKAMTGNTNSKVGRKQSQETKEKIRQANLGKRMSEETKNKIRETRNRKNADK